jgi:hypothetical protein
MLRIANRDLIDIGEIMLEIAHLKNLIEDVGSHQHIKVREECGAFRSWNYCHLHIRKEIFCLVC